MIKMGNPIHHKWVNCSLFTSRLTFIILFKCVVKLMHRGSISILYHGHSSVNLGISEQKKNHYVNKLLQYTPVLRFLQL